MTHRRLWTEEGRERSLDNLVDLLEGYYRCRPGSSPRDSSCKPAAPSLSYSVLGYLEFLNKLGQAYATLPLRVLAQMYTRECEGPSSTYKPHAEERCGDLKVEPQSLTLFLERDNVVDRFGVRFRPKADIRLGSMGFKDASGKTYDAAHLVVHDDRGEWSDPLSKHFTLSLGNFDYRTVTFKVVVPDWKTSPSVLTTELNVFGDGAASCLKLKLYKRNT